MTVPRGGVGSNQYATRGSPGSSPRRAETGAAVCAVEDDVEQVSWVFAPNEPGAWEWAFPGRGGDARSVWASLGFNAVQAHQMSVEYTAAGVDDMDDQVRWAELRFTPSDTGAWRALLGSRGFVTADGWREMKVTPADLARYQATGEYAHLPTGRQEHTKLKRLAASVWQWHDPYTTAGMLAHISGYQRPQTAKMIADRWASAVIVRGDMKSWGDALLRIEDEKERHWEIIEENLMFQKAANRRPWKWTPAMRRWWKRRQAQFTDPGAG